MDAAIKTLKAEFDATFDSLQEMGVTYRGHRLGELEEESRKKYHEYVLSQNFDILLKESMMVIYISLMFTLRASRRLSDATSLRVSK